MSVTGRLALSMSLPFQIQSIEFNYQWPMIKNKCLQKGGPRKLPLCNREVVAGRCSGAWRSASPTRGDLSYHPLGCAWVPYFLTCYHPHGSFLSPVSYASELSNYFDHFAELDFIYSVENPTMKYQEK